MERSKLLQKWGVREGVEARASTAFVGRLLRRPSRERNDPLNHSAALRSNDYLVAPILTLSSFSH